MKQREKIVLRLRWYGWRVRQLTGQNVPEDKAGTRAFDEVRKIRDNELLAWLKDHPNNASSEATVPNR